jgi:isochorismate synthase
MPAEPGTIAATPPQRQVSALEASAARLTSVTRSSAAIDPIEVFCAASTPAARSLWLRPASGEALVGLGSAATFQGTPEQVAADWRALMAHAHVESISDVGPRLLGGFNFDAHATHTQLWDGFGVGRLVLPELLFRTHAGATLLTTNRVSGKARSVARAIATSPEAARTGLSPEDWQALVADVATVIRHAGAGLRKVVLARALQVELRVSLEAALRRLAVDYPSCTIFAFATPQACFLGATPERLVALHDGTATTMALAGTAPRGETPEQDRAIGERLLRDPKERTEHAVVADALREALAPLATRVVADVEPRLHVLPNVQHLITPMRAQMQAGRGVLDLVSRLHPTPAVGGYPREAALHVIRERENLDRGWYAAPIGWVDARGEGEFVVGLRSALLRGEAATLFAGCGIVADSDPTTELAEWGWKLRPMATALGAS